MNQARRRAAIGAAIAVGLAATFLITRNVNGSAEAASAGPPQGLTKYGREVWNLEGVLRDTFGDRVVCYHWKTSTFRTRCVPISDNGIWSYTFVGAQNSAFRLVLRQQPPQMGNAAAIRVRNQYVSCGKGRLLVRLHGGSNFSFGCYPEH